MPDQCGDNAPAQQDETRHDADDPYFYPPNVAGLLGIGAVQKAPGECRENHGQPARTGDTLEERNCEQAKEEFLVRGSEEPDRNAGYPRKRSAHRVLVVQLLRSPDAHPTADQVEGDYEADMRRGQTESYHG